MKNSVPLIITSNTDLSRLSTPVNRVIFRSMPSNCNIIWFWIGGAAKESWSYPLDIGDSQRVFLTDLSQLNFLFINSDDKIALIYEVEK